MGGETSCNCIDRIDADMEANGHMLYATMGLQGPRRALVALVRRDTWEPERRRNKPHFMIANYCPWCGEKYPAPLLDRAIAAEEAQP